MNDRFSVGFIGFGEAGFEIAKRLHATGVTRMCLYDLRTQDPDRAALVR
ncbi:MAG: hypothetical protein Q7W38_08890 [Deltaproteobacteria bacterium]|nr:hypothetical protein [Deltaproteobacteria bacterium]